MGTLSRICVALGAFLLVAGAVYGLTSHEPAGTALLLIASATFWFLGAVARHVVRLAEGSEEASIEVHVAPTIWPFGFALSAVVLGLAIIVSPLFLVPGVIGFVACAAGWLREVARSHAHAD
jgi:hypothetical protein